MPAAGFDRSGQVTLMWACDEEEALVVVVVVVEGRAAGMGVCAWCRMGAGVNTKTNKPKPCARGWGKGVTANQANALTTRTNIRRSLRAAATAKWPCTTACSPNKMTLPGADAMLACTPLLLLLLLLLVLFVVLLSVVVLVVVTPLPLSAGAGVAAALDAMLVWFVACGAECCGRWCLCIVCMQELQMYP